MNIGKMPQDTNMKDKMNKGEIYKKRDDSFTFSPSRDIVVFLRTRKGPHGNMIVLHYSVDGDRRKIGKTNHANFLYHFYRYI